MRNLGFGIVFLGCILPSLLYCLKPTKDVEEAEEALNRISIEMADSKCTSKKSAKAFIEAQKILEEVKRLYQQTEKSGDKSTHDLKISSLKKNLQEKFKLIDEEYKTCLNMPINKSRIREIRPYQQTVTPRTQTIDDEIHYNKPPEITVVPVGIAGQIEEKNQH